MEHLGAHAIHYSVHQASLGLSQQRIYSVVAEYTHASDRYHIIWQHQTVYLI